MGAWTMKARAINQLAKLGGAEVSKAGGFDFAIPHDCNFCQSMGGIFRQRIADHIELNARRTLRWSGPRLRYEIRSNNGRGRSRDCVCEEPAAGNWHHDENILS